MLLFEAFSKARAGIVTEVPPPGGGDMFPTEKVGDLEKFKLNP